MEIINIKEDINDPIWLALKKARDEIMAQEDAEVFRILDEIFKKKYLICA